MSIVAAIALASATLHGGQAQQPQGAQRPASASPAAPTPSAATPARPVPIASTPRQAPAMAVAAQRQLLDQYCVTCHNNRAKTGGVVLDTVDLTNVGPHAELLEKAVRRVRAGLMPPNGAARPDAATLTSLAAGLEASLDRAAATPNLVAPG
jgi:mono/diheme cytochrome c family protein